MLLNPKFYILLLLIGFGFGDLIGPDGLPIDDELKPENPDEEEQDDLDPNAQLAPEDMTNINQVVNEQVKEYLAAVKKFNEMAGDFKAEASATNKILDSMKSRTEKILGQINQAWLDSVLVGEGDADMETTESTLSENSKEILNQLPPLTDDAEEELTPELQEAKALYDAALVKLKRRSPEVLSAILQVKEAAEKGYLPAKIKLAWSHVYGEGVEMDLEKARGIFEELAAEGNADAHAGMGFLYANGLSVPVSQAKALVHYQMGALGGSWYASMALGYRYWSGHTVPASCPSALQLYSKLAAKVAAGVSWSGGGAIQRVRLTEEADGGAMDTDLIEYYQLLAEKGDVQAQVGLGQLHFQGGRGVTLDISKALHYFQQAANAGNAIANAFLGKIYLEGGDGIKPDNDTALRYFRKAAEMNNPVGQSGLGLMYLQGRGVPKDTTTAFKYFTMAANQGWVEGQLHLGYMYFGGIGMRRDFKQANKYFSLASQSGHILAFYHLGLMHAEGLGVMRSCTTALDLFKNVCERGEWGTRLMSAYAAYRARNVNSALMQYLSMADIGYEVAQTNVAYLLDSGEVSLWSGTERWSRALAAWNRAAAQGYAAARVKLGDYYYYGHGTKQDLELAAHHYRIASEQQHNAQAMFNLGYMHERGLGLARDLHLAKRCYDLAADASPDARLPAALALARLNAAVALTQLKDSPLAVIFLTGESSLLSNWDLYLMTALLGALGLVVYLRRPAERPANR